MIIVIIYCVKQKSCKQKILTKISSLSWLIGIDRSSILEFKFVRYSAKFTIASVSFFKISDIWSCSSAPYAFKSLLKVSKSDFLVYSIRHSSTVKLSWNILIKFRVHLSLAFDYLEKWIFPHCYINWFHHEYWFKECKVMKTYTGTKIFDPTRNYSTYNFFKVLKGKINKLLG